MNLVIVESPTKAKTISRFLGKDYIVTSSYGHIRDLPKGELGVDVEHDFEPKYVIPTASRKTVNKLKKEAEGTEAIILATDEDREGEAIAWHISQALGLANPKPQTLNPKPVQRIVFHEITKPAILEALKNPRSIDMNLVDAQQARRILDRLVGYKLSPLLWKKVMAGLSAGRVQSVALRLIVEREREREKFVPQEYWTVEAELKKESGESFKAKFWKRDNIIIKDLDLKSKVEVDEILAGLAQATWSVADVSVKEVRRNPLPPFTTSTLQQEASRRLYFSAKQTMRVAQQLYEQGFITYMRTDSVNLSAESREAAEKYIKENYGASYSAPKTFKTKSRLAQEAHEAIRPTDPTRTSETLKTSLDARQLKLYDLIWRRFLASQMSAAVFDSTAAVIETKTPYTFRASGLVQKFDGFLKIWPQKTTETLLPPLAAEEKLALEKLLPERHETQPPGRYSEATLVKTLEEYGIGRPSTYAPIMSTIQERGYVQKDESRKFYPAKIGVIVNDLLVEHFPNIVNVNFTAHMEEDLDEIARGKKDWVPTVREFWVPFSVILEKKTVELKRAQFKKDEPTDRTCPHCGRPLVLKLGRFGKFYACSGFPACRFTENHVEKIGLACPECGQGEVVVKRSKRGKTFYGCSRYPDCKYASWKNPKSNTNDTN